MEGVYVDAQAREVRGDMTDEEPEFNMDEAIGGDQAEATLGFDVFGNDDAKSEGSADLDRRSNPSKTLQISTALPSNPDGEVVLPSLADMRQRVSILRGSATATRSPPRGPLSITGLTTEQLAAQGMSSSSSSSSSGSSVSSPSRAVPKPIALLSMQSGAAGSFSSMMLSSSSLGSSSSAAPAIPAPPAFPPPGIPVTPVTPPASAKPQPPSRKRPGAGRGRVSMKKAGSSSSAVDEVSDRLASRFGSSGKEAVDEMVAGNFTLID